MLVYQNFQPFLKVVYDTFIKKTEKFFLNEVLALFFNSANGVLLVARATVYSSLSVCILKARVYGQKERSPIDCTNLSIRPQFFFREKFSKKSLRAVLKTLVFLCKIFSSPHSRLFHKTLLKILVFLHKIIFINIF